MDILYKSDGSIKYISQAEYVNQRSNLANYIFVAFVDDKGKSTTEGNSAEATFVYPNEMGSSILYGSATNKQVDGDNYAGFLFKLTSTQTQYAGTVQVSIDVVSSDGTSLFTYTYNMTVNPTSIGESTLTTSEIESLLESMAQYQIMYSEHNVRYYSSQEDAINDDGLADGQIYGYEDDSGYLSFAIVSRVDDTRADTDITFDTSSVIGSLSDLDTDTKTNIVSAINEIYGKTADAIKASAEASGDIGLYLSHGGTAIEGQTPTLLSSETFALEDGKIVSLGGGGATSSIPDSDIDSLFNA